jgi:hypothetical protein
MATVYDIVKGINQAAANAYDCSHDERLVVDGEAKKVGLKREQGDFINDSRVMDGFKVKISGPQLTISYHSELPIRDIHNTKLDEEIEQIYADIVKFLKKEYKHITGETLSLKDEGPAKILLQNMSRIRTWIECQKVYTIKGLKDVIEVGIPSEDRLEKNFRKFLELSTDKRPENDKRKTSD